MGRKINPNSKRQLKLKIKEMQKDFDRAWKMILRREKRLWEEKIPSFLRKDEFILPPLMYIAQMEELDEQKE